MLPWDFSIWLPLWQCPQKENVHDDSICEHLPNNIHDIIIRLWCWDCIRRIYTEYSRFICRVHFWLKSFPLWNVGATQVGERNHWEKIESRLGPRRRLYSGFRWYSNRSHPRLQLLDEHDSFCECDIRDRPNSVLDQYDRLCFLVCVAFCIHSFLI